MGARRRAHERQLGRRLCFGRAVWFEFSRYTGRIHVLAQAGTVEADEQEKEAGEKTRAESSVGGEKEGNFPPASSLPPISPGGRDCKRKMKAETAEGKGKGAAIKCDVAKNEDGENEAPPDLVCAGVNFLTDELEAEMKDWVQQEKEEKEQKEETQRREGEKSAAEAELRADASAKQVDQAANAVMQNAAAAAEVEGLEVFEEEGGDGGKGIQDATTEEDTDAEAEAAVDVSAGELEACAETKPAASSNGQAAEAAGASTVGGEAGAGGRSSGPAAATTAAPAPLPLPALPAAPEAAAVLPLLRCWTGCDAVCDATAVAREWEALGRYRGYGARTCARRM